jgi:hypothetical protein
MNRLSSPKTTFSSSMLLAAVLMVLCSACGAAIPVTGADIAPEPTRQDPFNRYGFEVTGFTPEQEAVIETTLAAYDRALGGQGRLRSILLVHNGGELRPITYNPNRVGANSEITLSPTVFSLELSNARNYSVYASTDETAHAQIVIGHEVGHILVKAILRRTGVDWEQVYRQGVGRSWETIGDPTAPGEEAVTELSLYVQGMGYFFSLDGDEPETDPQVTGEINRWVLDFIKALKVLE